MKITVENTRVLVAEYKDAKLEIRKNIDTGQVEMITITKAGAQIVVFLQEQNALNNQIEEIKQFAKIIIEDAV